MTSFLISVDLSAYQVFVDQDAAPNGTGALDVPFQNLQAAYTEVQRNVVNGTAGYWTGSRYDATEPCYINIKSKTLVLSTSFTLTMECALSSEQLSFGI